jgi:glutathione peroxidase
MRFGQRTLPVRETRNLLPSRPGILGSEAIKWNFTKFLVDRAGNPVKRYASREKPEDIDKDINDLMAASKP